MGRDQRTVRLTVQTLKILGSVLSSAPDELAGSEIASLTKLQSGTLYPILLRLEEAGWLKSRWEIERPQALGRPRRRLYQLTALGAKQSKQAFRDVKSAIGEALWT